MPITDWSFLVVIATILVAPGPTNTLFALLWISLGSALMGGRFGWLQPQRFQRVAALTLFGFSAWLVTQGLGSAPLASGALAQS